MQEAPKKIKNFYDLDAWRESNKLVVQVYKATNEYPKSEIFGLTNQTRRAVVSITSNIAEGFSRGTYKDKSQFFSIALGSLTELQNQLIIGKELGYLDAATFKTLSDQTIIASKLINGLIKSCRNKYER